MLPYLEENKRRVERLLTLEESYIDEFYAQHMKEKESPNHLYQG